VQVVAAPRRAWFLEYLDQSDRFRHAGIRRVLIEPCDPDAIVHALRAILG